MYNKKLGDSKHCKH